LYGEEYALNVDVEYPIVVLLRDCAKRGDFEDARVGEQDINMTSLLFNHGIEPVEIRPSGHIALHAGNVFPDLFHCFVEFARAAPSDKNMSSFRGEPLRGSESNAAGTTSAHRDFSIKFPIVLYS